MPPLHCALHDLVQFCLTASLTLQRRVKLLTAQWPHTCAVKYPLLYAWLLFNFQVSNVIVFLQKSLSSPPHHSPTIHTHQRGLGLGLFTPYRRFVKFANASNMFMTITNSVLIFQVNVCILDSWIILLTRRDYTLAYRQAFALWTSPKFGLNSSLFHLH